MNRPGTTVIESDAPAGATFVSDTGTWFIAGMSQKGSTDEAVLIESPGAFADQLGDDVPYSNAKASVSAAIAQGARRVYFARFVGAAATRATVALSNGTATTLTVQAKDVGDYANGDKIDVLTHAEDSTIPSGSFVIVHKDALGNVIERSVPFADEAAALAWAAETVVVVDDAATGNPVHVTDAVLTGGSDDRASVTDATKTAALDRFVEDYGPGQVTVLGSTSNTVRQALAQHCADVKAKRVAYCDAIAGDRASVKADALAARAALGDLAKHVLIFSPSAIVGGQTIPYTAVQAGLTAAVDSLGNPNQAPAGKYGRATVVDDLTTTWTRDDVEDLITAGVNCAIFVKGEVRTYGFRTLADKAAYPLHWQGQNVRLDEAIAARADLILEEYVEGQIDPKGIEAAAYGGDLSAMLDEFVAVGAIWPLKDGSKFKVDTGPTVNTTATIADGQLKAKMQYARSAGAEAVVLEVVKTPVGS